MRKITKRAAIIGTAIALAAGGGIAWAAFTSSVSGTANANSATISTTGTITQTALGSPAFIPDSTRTVTINVPNTNTYNVKVTSITGTSAQVDGCAAGAVNVVGWMGATPALPKVIGAGGSQAFTVTIAMGSVGNECAGKDLPVTYTAALESTNDPA